MTALGYATSGRSSDRGCRAGQIEPPQVELAAVGVAASRGVHFANASQVEPEVSVNTDSSPGPDTPGSLARMGCGEASVPGPGDPNIWRTPRRSWYRSSSCPSRRGGNAPRSPPDRVLRSCLPASLSRGRGAAPAWYRGPWSSPTPPAARTRWWSARLLRWTSTPGTVPAAIDEGKRIDRGVQCRLTFERFRGRVDEGTLWLAGFLHPSGGGGCSRRAETYTRKAGDLRRHFNARFYFAMALDRTSAPPTRWPPTSAIARSSTARSFHGPVQNCKRFVPVVDAGSVRRVVNTPFRPTQSGMVAWRIVRPIERW